MPNIQNLELDRTDRRILQLLQQDARLTNQDIAERVNLSPSPCLRRIKRLEEQMSRLTEQKSTLDARLADSAIYEPEQKNELRTVQEEHASCSKALETLEAEWLEQQEALEKLAA
jgi:DNA-binding Lrp family transcriptional regulator